MRYGAVQSDRDSLARAAGWPDDHRERERVAETLVTDGLACWANDHLVLPR